MTDLRDIAAIGGLITGYWRPVLTAATTIVGCVLVAKTLPKDTLGWIERGMSSLVTTGGESLHTAPAGRGDEAAPATLPDAAPTHGLDHAPEPESERLSAPAPPDPAAIAPASAADRASISDDGHAADGEQILGRYLRMDTASTVDGLEFTMEVPGLKETDLEIRLVGDTIVITGRWDLDRTDKTFRVVEREFGPFSRFIKISEGVPLQRIQASLDRGLLTVFVPNPTVQVGKTIAINSAVRRLFDGDDLCELKIDLPGVDESDVDLAVQGGVLTINCRQGDRTADTVPPRLLESMELPAGVDANQIRAVLAKGVLTVTLPIAAAHRQRTIPLETVDGACPSATPFGAPMDPPFDFWSAGEILAGRSVHMGESTDRRF
jgi:HSP20 family molecular chaperone IbpA